MTGMPWNSTARSSPFLVEHHAILEAGATAPFDIDSEGLAFLGRLTVPHGLDLGGRSFGQNNDRLSRGLLRNLLGGVTFVPTTIIFRATIHIEF